MASSDVVSTCCTVSRLARPSWTAISIGRATEGHSAGRPRVHIDGPRLMRNCAQQTNKRMPDSLAGLWSHLHHSAELLTAAGLQLPTRTSCWQQADTGHQELELVQAVSQAAFLLWSLACCCSIQRWQANDCIQCISESKLDYRVGQRLGLCRPAAEISLKGAVDRCSGQTKASPAPDIQHPAGRCRVPQAGSGAKRTGTSRTGCPT